MSSEEPQNVDDIISRLKEYLNVEHDYELSLKMGLGKSTINQWRNRHSVNLKYIMKMFPEISINWLTKGIGGKTIPKNLVNEEHAQYVLSSSIDRVKRSAEIVKALGLELSMVGRLVADEELFLILEDLYIERETIKKQKGPNTLM